MGGGGNGTLGGLVSPPLTLTLVLRLRCDYVETWSPYLAANQYSMAFFFFFFFFCPYLWHMEGARRWFELWLQLPASTTVTATPDPSHVCDLCCSLWEHWILNPLRPGIKPISSWILRWVLNPLSHNRDSTLGFCQKST